jgi:hypothetical protein
LAAARAETAKWQMAYDLLRRRLQAAESQMADAARTPEPKLTHVLTFASTSEPISGF